MSNNNIDFNEQFQRALRLMSETDSNIFITGKAGTGKSTLLEYFTETTKKKAVVLAPTGVAALNVGGQTIHSFFRFKPDITIDSIQKYYGQMSKLCKAVDMIIIDEISMVRADLLDCIDKCLRLNGKNPKKPFGGVQMVFFGDLYQLAPVVRSGEKAIFKDIYKTPYFFDASSFKDIDIEFVELEKIYRQKDQKFIDILNAIRNNSVTEDDLEKINVRFNPDFKPENDEFYILLTPTNSKALKINEMNLEKIKKPLFTSSGIINGKFDLNQLPTEMELKLKIGSQVMLVNNDLSGRWVNGSIGTIFNIEKNKNGKDFIIVRLNDGKLVNVSKYNWEMFRFAYNPSTRGIESEIIGSFAQYPIRLAWAVTIHKSQGKTFEKVIVDFDKGTFAHGQAYVALSRCTTLNGLVLKKPVEKKHILMDWRIVKFLTNFQYDLSNKILSINDKVDLIKKAIKDKKRLEITYLKTNDQKSKRVIIPKRVGLMEYLGKEYLGIEAYCCLRQDDRVFRVDRVLDLKEAKDEQ